MQTKALLPCQCEMFCRCNTVLSDEGNERRTSAEGSQCESNSSPVSSQQQWRTCKQPVDSTIGNDGKVIFIFCLLTPSANTAWSGPGTLIQRCRGVWAASVILNRMTQDSLADSLDRCMLGDLCVHPLAGPQEQILTVYFSKLKATGRQQFLYFWASDKLNSCKMQTQLTRSIFYYLLIPCIWECGGKKNKLLWTERYWLAFLDNKDISITQGPSHCWRRPNRRRNLLRDNHATAHICVCT